MINKEYDVEDVIMCSDLQDWQKKITEYFSKQEELPYHTGDPRRCGKVNVN